MTERKRDFFRFDLRGIEIMETLRAALGNKTTLIPREEHKIVDESGVIYIGDTWVREVFSAHEVAKVAMDVRQFDHGYWMPEIKMEGMENTRMDYGGDLIHMMVNETGWEIRCTLGDSMSRGEFEIGSRSNREGYLSTDKITILEHRPLESHPRYLRWLTAAANLPEVKQDIRDSLIQMISDQEERDSYKL